MIVDFPEYEMRNLALGVCEAVVTDDELGVNGGAGARVILCVLMALQCVSTSAQTMT